MLLYGVNQLIWLDHNLMVPVLPSDFEAEESTKDVNLVVFRSNVYQETRSRKQQI